MGIRLPWAGLEGWAGGKGRREVWKVGKERDGSMERGRSKRKEGKEVEYGRKEGRRKKWQEGRRERK